MTRRPAALFAAVLAAAGAAPPAPVELDFGANPKLFNTHFGRYGPRPTRVIVPEGAGLRLRLPAESGGAKPVGLYSYFVLAGDFEITAGYEVLDVPRPTAGYGAGFGFAVDTDGPDGNLTVRRGHWEPEGTGFQVVRETRVNGERKYEATFYPSAAKAGRVVLRRVNDAAVLLAAGTPAEEPAELGRVPFSAKTVRTMRIVVDPGGSPTPVHGRITGLKVRAEEITGGIPERERHTLPGWLAVVTIGVAGGLGLWLWWIIRRRKRPPATARAGGGFAAPG